MKEFLKSFLPQYLLDFFNFRYLKSRITYQKDGLITTHNSDFQLNEKFQKAYSAGKATNSWGSFEIQWRVHTVLWAANRSIQLDGDFVECGVNRGGLSRSIVEYTGFQNVNKTFYLFDTFEGFDYTVLSENEKKMYLNQNKYGDNYAQIKDEFKNYKNVIITKGSVPNSLNTVTIEKVAFLSIDMNCVLPEIAALEHFWDKMCPGGVIVLDDYGFVEFKDQYEAHNSWAISKGIEIMSLPTGQGLIIK